MTYDPMTAKFIAAVAEEMPPLDNESMAAWTANRVALRDALKRVFSLKAAPRYAIWKKVTVDTLVSPDTVTMALSRAGIISTRYLHHLTTSGTYPADLGTYDLVAVPLWQLGHECFESVPEIYEAARERGLLPCFPELSPLIWLQHPHVLPLGMKVWVSVNSPNRAKHGYHYVNYLANETYGRVIGTARYSREKLWGPHDTWVFVLPRS